LPDFYYYDLNSKLTYSPASNNILSLSFYNGHDKLDESQDLGQLNFRTPLTGGTGSTANSSIQDITTWGNTGVSGKWARVWSDRLYSNVLAAYSVYRSESQSGFSTRGGTQNTIQRAFSSQEKNEVVDFSMRFDNEYQLTSSHKLELGAAYTKSQVVLNFTANDTISILNRHDEATQSAFYLQDQWKIFKPFELTFGIRATNYEPTKTTYWEPRASFRFDLTNHVALKGAWGHYHQFVNRIVNENVLEGNRDFWLLADKQLEPNFAEHKILGLSYESANFLFDVEAYNKDLDGVAEFSQRFRRRPGQAVEELFFLGAGVSRGIEFLAQKKSGKLNGWLSYTLGKTEYDIEVFNNGEPYPASQHRRHELKLVGNYGLGKWNFAATWVYASGAPYTSPESQYAIELLDGNERSYIHVSDKNANRLPPYHRLDLSATYHLSSRTMTYDFGFSIFNVYNRANVWYREYVLDTSPVIVRDVTTLGFTPTLTFRIGMK
jgi:outer membrane receptor for ferrienterochelin and colicin